MNKKIQKLLLIILIFISIFSTFQLDCTKNKRYSISDTSKKIAKSIDDKIKINIYLEGDFPASFKELQRETINLISELRKINSNITYKVINPIKEKISFENLRKLGIKPSTLPDIQDGKISKILIYPYVVIKYKKKNKAISLLSSKLEYNLKIQIKNSMEELEYKLIQSIYKLIKPEKKKIGFLVHHDELKPNQFAGFMEHVSKDFEVKPYFPINSQSLSIPDISRMKSIDALVIAKPRKKIKNEEKIVLDQYLMNGGNIFWMIDVVNADIDSLFHSNKIFTYGEDLNLSDYFFSYGIRINSTLVKDYEQNVPIRLVTGEIQGNPQFTNLGWSYFPLGISDNTHSITKNVNPVKFEFASPIQLLPTKGIKKTILYKTSFYTSIKQTPNYIELSEIIKMNDSIIKDVFVGNMPLAVLLEGKFQSIYKDRIENQSIPNFISKTNKVKIIVVSDGDFAKNQIYNGKPIQLGLDLLLNKVYGNPDFIINALHYLTDEVQLMNLRNRSISISYLDSNKIFSNASYWKYFNFLIPTIFYSLTAFFIRIVKKRKFSY